MSGCQEMIDLIGENNGPIVSRGHVEADGVCVPSDWEGYLEPHPEGADRGGYLPCFESSAGDVIFWDDTDCRWLPWNDED